MNNTRIIYGLIAALGAFMPVIGIIIGCIRYNNRGEIVKKEVHEEYKEAQERGGLASLYHKRQGRMIFARTFGVPIVVFFIIGLTLMIIGFSGL